MQPKIHDFSESLHKFHDIRWKWIHQFVLSSSYIGILNLHDLVQRYMLYYIFVPRIYDVITSFVQEWNSHPLKSEIFWMPQQIWTNGMIEQKRRGFLHIAETNYIPVSSEDLEWFGMVRISSYWWWLGNSEYGFSEGLIPWHYLRHLE